MGSKHDRQLKRRKYINNGKKEEQEVQSVSMTKGEDIDAQENERSEHWRGTERIQEGKE